MNWEVIYLPEVRKDLRALSEEQRDRVFKSIRKVRQNPLPMNEGGFGKPLGNKGGTNLKGMLKIKLRADGIRVVYKLIRTENTMHIIVIGARADEEVYHIAGQRVRKYHL